MVITMKINDAMKITGLSKKAIRLYEERGLLAVRRTENSYRDYTDGDIERLRQIKLLRLAGVSLSDIRLWCDRVVTIEELLAKRKRELERESGLHSDQVTFCDTILLQFRGGGLDSADSPEETEESDTPSHGDLAVGIDLGTTSISASVMDLTAKRQVVAYTIPNSFAVKGTSPFFAEQDGERIIGKAMELLDHILGTYQNVRSIGITGQMHGILYIDREGHGVSNLVTWQDKRADEQMSDGVTYCERIRELTGMTIATGYGLATHYYNAENGLVPADAVTFCSVMDYLAMELTGRTTPVVHTSNAASFGLFDVKNLSFKEDAVAALPMGHVRLPEVTVENAVLGEYRGIPVSVAIGDNQASFLGSVKTIDRSILLNIGTGSQISLVTEYCDADEKTELRPLLENKYLLCGSALCGGSAYAMLERFFRAYTVSGGGKDEPQYELMNRLAWDAYETHAPALTVDTTFGGTRHDPAKRGSISPIDEGNFTPGSLILGFIRGMCDELYSLLPPERLGNVDSIVASGGAVQRNPVLRAVISDRFGVPLSLNKAKEEASSGAALFSALAAGYLKEPGDFAAFITY